MPLVQPAPMTPFDPALTRLPAIAVKAKILMPGSDGSGNPIELVSQERFTLQAGDAWATANGLTGITFADYVDGTTPGTDLAGRILSAYGPAFQMNSKLVFWALVSAPTAPADAAARMFLGYWNSYGASLRIVSNGGNEGLEGFFLKTQTDSITENTLEGQPALPPGSLASVIAVLAPTGQASNIYLNGVVQTSGSTGYGTVAEGDLTTEHETPYNLGFAQNQNHLEDGTPVPGTDRFVIHGAAILEGVTAPELATFVADPFGVMTPAEVASPSRRRRLHARRLALGIYG